MSFSQIFQNDLKTIFAPSTPLSYSAVAVFRISGKLAKSAFTILKTSINLEKIEPRKAYFTKIFDENDEILDSCIMIFFSGPKSFTGEDLVEIQTHGSPLITRILCGIFEKQNGFAHAQQGEFSRRALMNQKIDLIQAEGLLKLIHSQTKKQLQVAHKELGGEISQIFNDLRSSIIENLSFIEALIDFPEDDIDNSFYDQEMNFARKVSQIELNIKKNLENLGEKIKKFLSDGEINQKIIDGFEIPIIGKPNSGKSSLLNYICGEDLAIVSELPGTTRDLLEKRLDFDGYLVKFVDSAGIREIDENQNFSKIEQAHIQIEKLGIEKAFKISSKAHLLLILIDSFDFENNNFFDQKIFEEKYDFLKKKEILEKIDSNRVIFVLTKMDNDSCDEVKNFSFLNNENNFRNELIPVSAQSGKGLSLLKNEILKKIKKFFPDSDPVIGSKRQRSILEEAYNLIQFIILNFENFEYIDLLAEEMRKLAILSASLTESISNEEILNSLFSKFCIGK